MEEFYCIPNPKPENWMVFEHALNICSDILKSCNYRPSVRNQEAIIKLLLTQVENCYGTEQSTSRNPNRENQRDS